MPFLSLDTTLYKTAEWQNRASGGCSLNSESSDTGKKTKILTIKMPWESTVICALAVVVEMLPVFSHWNVWNHYLWCWKFFFLQIRPLHNDRSSHLFRWKQGMFGIFFWINDTIFSAPGSFSIKAKNQRKRRKQNDQSVVAQADITQISLFL